jgi:UDP-4-amino-4,6-dideoxy-N-acetyl-beta-L-altrosamine transaminase
MKPIPYGKQSINEEDIKSVVDALKSDFLTQGPLIEDFELKFAKYVGSKYAIAVSNGTAALHLCCLSLNTNKASNVITTPITFAASSNCVRYCGGNIYFADINPITYLIDLEKIEKLILSNPPNFFHGIIAVNFAGLSVDFEALDKIAKKYNLWVIEDACHSPGGYFTDSNKIKQLSGNCNFADLSIFSFHPVKHIACGEGGMITTNNKELYDKLLLLRTHGITKNPNLLTKNDGGWYYEMQVLGFNYRLTDFQAALGISQLKRADAGLNRRKEIARRYNEAFSSNENILNHSGYKENHAYHLYIINIEKRKELYDYLKELQIYCQVHYIPIHTFPYYKEIGNQNIDLANSEKYYETCLSLPMFPTLTAEEQEYVIKSVISFFEK